MHFPHNVTLNKPKGAPLNVPFSREHEDDCECDSCLYNASKHKIPNIEKLCKPKNEQLLPINLTVKEATINEQLPVVSQTTNDLKSNSTDELKNDSNFSAKNSQNGKNDSGIASFLLKNSKISPKLNIEKDKAPSPVKVMKSKFKQRKNAKQKFERDESDPNRIFEWNQISVGVSGQKHKIQTNAVMCWARECYEYFLGLHDLDSHLEEVHRIMVYQCALERCSHSFSTKLVLSTATRHVLTLVLFNSIYRKNLVLHTQQYHSGVSSWLCSKCTVKFKSGWELHQHNIFCHHEGIFRCQKCYYLKKYRSDIIEHYDQTHGDS